MNNKIMTFEHIEIEKQKFRGLENPMSINHVNIDRMIIPNGVSFGEKVFKDFIVYENNYEKTMTLYIMLPKMSAYRRGFDETKYVFFDKR